MVDRRAEVERTRAHAEHVSWLQSQHSDLQEHRRSHEASLRDEDFAVGSDVLSYQFESVPSFSMSDEDARYRSLDMMPSIVHQQSADVEVIEEALVYRSLPPLARQPSEQSTSTAAQLWPA